MERSQIILEYIKVLMWPLILLLGFAFYSEHFFEIIKSREVELFGLKIGNQVDEIASSYKAELEDLKAQMKQAGDSALLQKVENIEANLERELAQVKQSAIGEGSLSAAELRKQQVVKLEHEGFVAMMNQDLESAISAFSAARTLWPGYHNVSEIEALLLTSKTELVAEDSAEVWQNIYEVVMNRYSWGMPVDIRQRMVH